MNPAISSDEETTASWDAYWSASKKRRLYDFVAEIYRKFLIRPNLNRFVKNYLPDNADTLHAGSGGGQVDREIRSLVRITALDISPKALAVYRRNNGDGVRVILGSIKEIPLPASSMDGIYNLGVMEHFTEGEILQILSEFRRVLRADGKLILFWPPEFGLSVLFFKALKWIFAHLLGKPDVEFHPPEICRLRSKAHGEAILREAGFRLINYSFGPRDLFTYSILVAAPA